MPIDTGNFFGLIGKIYSMEITYGYNVLHGRLLYPTSGIFGRQGLV
jgi:hypothetical protein